MRDSDFEQLELMIILANNSQIRLYDTLWYDCDTTAYAHSDPEEIGKTQGRERRKTARGWDLISTIERSGRVV